MAGTQRMSKEMLSALGETVSARRLSLGMSQQELADETGIDRPAISHVERGKRNPTFSILLRLSSGLKLRLSRLIGRAERAYEERR